MLVNRGVPWQLVLAGNTWKVMVPVGEPNPPDSVAVSTAVPAVVVRVIVEGETCVEMTVIACWTLSVSPLSPHCAWNGLLLASPLYDATQL